MSLSTSSSSSSRLVQLSTRRSKTSAIACTSAVLVLSFVMYCSASFIWITDPISAKQLNLNPNLHSKGTSSNSGSDNVRLSLNGESERQSLDPKEIEKRVVPEEKDVDHNDSNSSSSSSSNNKIIQERGELFSRKGTSMDQGNNNKIESLSNNPKVQPTTTNSKMSQRKLQKSLVQLMKGTYLTSFSFVEWTRVLLLMIGGPLIVGFTIALVFSQLFGEEESRRSKRSKSSRNRRRSSRKHNYDDDDDTNTTDDYDDEDYSTVEEMEEKKRAWQSRKEKLLQS